MITVTRPATLDEALSGLDGTGALPRAGGTDLTACLGSGVIGSAPVVDLSGVGELRGVDWLPDGSARVGALTGVGELAGDPGLADAYPALAAVARVLATPQVRDAATLGGNLLQRNRCWYLRNPAFDCFQTGGDSCPARSGDHLYGVVVDQGPCVAPHPSSLAVALLAHDATVLVAGAGSTQPEERPVADLYDGADPARDHVLAPGRVLVSVSLPVPVRGERSSHRRATGRSRSEWPLVEAVARLDCGVDGAGPVTRAAVAVGGVARTPLRLPGVESALVGALPGRALGPEAEDALADLASLCSPLPSTGYKVDLLRATVRDVLERALGVPRS
ncbi:MULTISPECIES: FAD binding domain-containing protein [Nocardiopsidaceae]|uniref:FAD binding domain-containing protein n=1 Tax=Streptomonospora nanhaiensis TaxID=1323731 RepID=A0ABY6YET2_9ACTN|nr:FAD binding domain-containing protein [Streptomonospora nanhaiensis]WAE70735.1 FAD binding domain-containing protein [Streptomonospora nanhaiensis]